MEESRIIALVVGILMLVVAFLFISGKGLRQDQVTATSQDGKTPLNPRKLSLGLGILALVISAFLLLFVAKIISLTVMVIAILLLSTIGLNLVNRFSKIK